MTTFNDKLRAAAKALEAGEIPEVRLPFWAIDEMPGGRVKLSGTYIRTTMSRAIDTGSISVRVDNDYFDKEERHEPGYLITFSGSDEASTNRKRKNGQERKAGARDLVRYLEKVMPDISDLEMKAQLGAIEGIKRFKQLINEKAGEQ